MNGLSRILHVQFTKEKPHRTDLGSKAGGPEGAWLWNSRVMRNQQRMESVVGLILGGASVLALVICLGTVDHFCRELVRVAARLERTEDYGSNAPSLPATASLSSDGTQAKTNGGALKSKS
jgi:hypothetical protein